MKTHQEIFDTVAKHLLTQGRPARIGSSCRYRGPGGTKCAVGALIPDELYDESIEGKGVPMLPQKLLPDVDLSDGLTTRMLHTLQCLHDSTKNLNEDGTYYRAGLLEDLRFFAISHDLNTEVLQ